jgi:hypothetical protein
MILYFLQVLVHGTRYSSEGQILECYKISIIKSLIPGQRVMNVVTSWSIFELFGKLWMKITGILLLSGCRRV